MSPIVLFFLLGLFAGLCKSDLRLPKSIFEGLSFFLLLTIGLKGGIEIQEQSFGDLGPQLLGVTLLGVVIPFVVFPVLKRIGRLANADCASLAAHYGSVSVGTFAVCVAFLNQNRVSFEPQVSLFVVFLEIPAILIGIFLAKGRPQTKKLGPVLMETFKSRAIVLLVGGLLIGALCGKEQLSPFTPFFFDMFYGVLALFLLEMGGIVSDQAAVFKKYGLFLLGFGVCMPLISGAFAMGIAIVLGLSLGGTVVLMTLGASASYIAVPAAMKISVPEANLSLSLGSSLGVTFPFNILFGIPVFYHFARIYAG